MLEPTVRPTGVSKPEAGGGSQPLEQQRFDALLAEARSGDGRFMQADAPAAQVVAPTAKEGANVAGDAMDAGRPAKANPLGPLSHVGAMDNASLRRIVAGGK